MVFVLTINVYGTAQKPDILIYENDTLNIFTNPLSDSSSKICKDASFCQKRCRSTNCWRGYVATYKIINKKLYLMNLSDCCDGKLKVDLSIAFQDKYDKNGVFISWFNDTIYAPRGEVIYYSHMGYETVYQKEIRLILNNGVLVKIDTLDNSKTKLNYYFDDEKLTKYLIENSPKGSFKNLKKELIVYVKILSNEQGKISSVVIPENYKSEYDNVIINTLLKISDWDILYRHGKTAELPWLFPLKINKKMINKYKK